MQLLLGKHAEPWQWRDRLREKLTELGKEGGQHLSAIAGEVYDIGRLLDRFRRNRYSRV